MPTAVSTTRSKRLDQYINELKIASRRTVSSRSLMARPTTKATIPLFFLAYRAVTLDGESLETLIVEFLELVGPRCNDDVAVAREVTAASGCTGLVELLRRSRRRGATRRRRRARMGRLNDRAGLSCFREDRARQQVHRARATTERRLGTNLRFLFMPCGDREGSNSRRIRCANAVHLRSFEVV